MIIEVVHSLDGYKNIHDMEFCNPSGGENTEIESAT
jgi:hypothetical protein